MIVRQQNGLLPMKVKMSTLECIGTTNNPEAPGLLHPILTSSPMRKPRQPDYPLSTYFEELSDTDSEENVILSRT